MSLHSRGITDILFLMVIEVAASVGGAADHWNADLHVQAKSESVRLRSQPTVEMAELSRSVGASILTAREVRDGWVCVGSGWLELENVVQCKDAIEYFRDKVARNPDVYAYSALTFAFLRIGDGAEASSSATIALRLDPESSVAQLAISAVHIAEEKWEDARICAQRACALDKKCFEGFIVIGQASEELDDLDAGIAAYSAAIALDANEGDPYVFRALLLARQGHHKRAIEDCTTAIRLNGRDTLSYLARGASWLGEGECDKAISDLDQAFRLNSGKEREFEIYFTRGTAWLRKGDARRAIKDLNMALDLAPDSQMESAALLHRGDAWRSTKNFARAVADYGAAVVADPRNAQAYVNRGQTRTELGSIEEGIDDFTKAITMRSGDAVAFNNRGNARRMVGDYAGAIADLNEAIRLMPTSSLAHTNMAFLLAACKDTSFRDVGHAIRVATKACDLSAWKDQRALTALGAAYAAAGDFCSAIRWQSEALKLLPNEENVSRASMESTLRDYRAGKPYRSHWR